MPLVKDEAIVLAKISYSESDRIVRLFTLKEGKISGLAKGGNKSQRRFMNTLEPFNVVRIEFAEKAGGLVRIQNADIIETNYGIDRGLRPFTVASVFAELVDRATKEKEANSALFAVLKEALGEVKCREPSMRDVLHYMLRILEVQGYLPNLKTCVFCNGGVKEKLFFSKERGGILCKECSRFLPHETYGCSTIDWLSAVASGTDKRSHEQAELEAMDIVEGFMEFHLNLRLRSLKILRGLGLHD